MTTPRLGAIVALFSLLVIGCDTLIGGSSAPAMKGEETAQLTHAPAVPDSIRRDHSSKIYVTLEAIEKVGFLDTGVQYRFWTFGGEVLGQFIRVREGDQIEFDLRNHPNNYFEHNIDLHAVTGPHGGGMASVTRIGATSSFSFTALHPGLYVYHCATTPVGMHIANGMYGLILVEPKGGLPKVDREFYVMQGEFYTIGPKGHQGYQPFSMVKALAEEPDYVVFNGSVGSLKGEKALRAKTGETIRLFVGNAGPSLISSFHIIGEIFDKVYGEGGPHPTHQSIQTTLIPAGGATIVEFKVEVPGTYMLVDHSIFRATDKGALGLLEVEGEPVPGVFSGKF